MHPADSDLNSRMEELYASARRARGRAEETVRRTAAMQLSFHATRQRYQQAWARSNRIREPWLSAQDDRLTYSAYARLQARLASLSVIEQAKGVVMAHCGWNADQAFDALRRISQRENIKVRDLAAKIVAATVQPAQAPSLGRRAQTARHPATQGAGDGQAAVIRISAANGDGRSAAG